MDRNNIGRGLKYASAFFALGAVAMLIAGHFVANAPPGGPEEGAAIYAILALFLWIIGRNHTPRSILPDSVSLKLLLLRLRLLGDERREPVGSPERLEGGADGGRDVPPWGTSNRPRLVGPRSEEGSR